MKEKHPFNERVLMSSLKGRPGLGPKGARMNKIKLFGLLFMCLVLLAAAPLTAFEKGTKVIGGSFYLGSIKRYDDIAAQHSLTINPQGSYFVLDNLCIDLDISLGWYMSKDDPTFPRYGIGFGGRYFVKRFYGGFSMFFETQKLNHYELVFEETPSHGDNIYVYDRVLVGTKWLREQELLFKLGYLFPIVKHIYLDAGVFYRVPLGKIKDSNGISYDNKLKTIGTKIGLAVYF